MITNVVPQRLSVAQLIRSMLLFIGSFLFALCLNSFIFHEAGHAFGGVLFGCKFERLNINPFGTGGWQDQCPANLTLTGKVVRGMGGQIFGLPLSIAVTLLLWRKRKPMLLPLLMSAAVICIGNLFSVLDSISSYPGFVFDYGLALQVGVPQWILWSIAIASLVFGIVFMNLLIPLAGISPTEPFWKLLVINLSTWPFYMVVRLMYQSMIGRNITGSISLLLLGVILATLTALAYKPQYKLLDRLTHSAPVLPSTDTVWLAIGLGVGLTVLLVVSNPI